MPIFNGKIVTFSGIDGAGKSTQIDLLIQYLERKKRRHVYLWTRGGYTGPFNYLKGVMRKLIGKWLPPPGRNKERDQAFSKPLVRQIWLSLAIIDLIVVYGLYMRLCRLIGRIVLADRYLWDTRIDFLLNFPHESIDQWRLWKMLEKFAPKPNLSFLLTVPVDVSLKRSKQKCEPFPDSEEVLKQRLVLYKEISCTPGWFRIDCIQTVDEVHKAILKVIG